MQIILHLKFLLCLSYIALFVSHFFFLFPFTQIKNLEGSMVFSLSLLQEMNKIRLNKCCSLTFYPRLSRALVSVESEN